jgi:hypothetical protein
MTSRVPCCHNAVGCAVVTLLAVGGSILSDTTPCSPEEVDWSFAGTYCLHLQRRRIRRAGNHRKEAVSSRCTGLHGAISQKTVFFTVNTVGASSEWREGATLCRYRSNVTNFTWVWVRSTTAYRTQLVSIYPRLYPCNRPWKAIGLWDVEVPTFSLDNRLTDGGKVIRTARRRLRL